MGLNNIRIDVFCFVFSLQSGVVISIMVGGTLMLTTGLMNLYTLAVTGTFMANIIAFAVVYSHIGIMTVSLIFAFFGAYDENPSWMKKAAVAMMIALLIYIVASIMSCLPMSYSFACLNGRCPDHIWTQDAHWRNLGECEMSAASYPDLKRSPIKPKDGEQTTEKEKEEELTTEPSGLNTLGYSPHIPPVTTDGGESTTIDTPNDSRTEISSTEIPNDIYTDVADDKTVASDKATSDYYDSDVGAANRMLPLDVSFLKTVGPKEHPGLDLNVAKDEAQAELEEAILRMRTRSPAVAGTLPFRKKREGGTRNPLGNSAINGKSYGSRKHRKLAVMEDPKTESSSKTIDKKFTHNHDIKNSRQSIQLPHESYKIHQWNLNPGSLNFTNRKENPAARVLESSLTKRYPKAAVSGRYQSSRKKNMALIKNENEKKFKEYYLNLAVRSSIHRLAEVLSAEGCATGILNIIGILFSIVFTLLYIAFLAYTILLYIAFANELKEEIVTVIS